MVNRAAQWARNKADADTSKRPSHSQEQGLVHQEKKYNAAVVSVLFPTRFRVQTTLLPHTNRARQCELVHSTERPTCGHEHISLSLFLSLTTEAHCLNAHKSVGVLLSNFAHTSGAEAAHP